MSRTAPAGQVPRQEPRDQPSPINPRVARMKHRLLHSPYDVCMARALHFTRSYRETAGLHPALRNALALKRTLERQAIAIQPDELLAGGATEKFLSTPLSVERGDFLRTLQMEIDILPRKIQPFRVDRRDVKAFWREVLPFWDGRTVRDAKARNWERDGLIRTRRLGVTGNLRELVKALRSAAYNGIRGMLKLAGHNIGGIPGLRKLAQLFKLRFELAKNNPTPATFCFDVQGHLSLGVDKVVGEGMEAIAERARRRLERLEREDPGDHDGRAFLQAVVTSLEASVHYAERHSRLAREMASRATDEGERRRLETIAANCGNVPRNRPRTFHEAMQAVWLALVVGQIQYGTHEVFAVGRMDQYLLPFYRADLETGRLTREGAISLLQEFYLKVSTSAEPIPEVGMETNAVLGNSQRDITIGGLTPDGRDGTNELSYLMLEAHELMGGAINQLSVRFHEKTPAEFARRTAEVFKSANGIAIYNDEAIIEGLLADGYSIEDARDYCTVGCIETSGQSNTHGCPGGHELVLPAVLLLALSRGERPPPTLGQLPAPDCGDPGDWATFEEFLDAVRRQLAHQVRVLVTATLGKDEAYRDLLPAPYVSALMDGCIERATDITRGGAKYDFTSIDVRGLATFVDSLLAVKEVVYEWAECTLPEFTEVVAGNFRGHEVLRQRIINTLPKYGAGDDEADALAQQVIEWIHAEAGNYRNFRGGKFRACYYSYGNHVIDGIMVGPTPDGRRRGDPISNGVSPSNLAAVKSPTDAMNTVAKFPPAQVSSGIALNLRFHPSLLSTGEGIVKFADLIRGYFAKGGMHVQPNVVSTKTLKAAQRHPERYRDLVVKVSGYSAYFTDLGRSIQDDIIKRHEFRGGAT
ncbi:MAG: pyruvate formate lyase family protein [Promethearchaeota archaeon]